MKKTILTGASVIAFSMTASATFAQSTLQAPVAPSDPAECSTAGNNCSVVDQDGNGNDVEVTQSGDDAVSSVTQTGANNEADVTQAGAGAQSEIDQTGEDHTATVDQTGNASSVIGQFNANNAAPLVGNTATVTQLGENQSEVRQLGENLTMTVSQSGGDFNQSYADQGGPPPPEANKEGDADSITSVTQTGSSNLSDSKQRADNASITVVQTGTGNESTVFQGAGTNNPADENGDRAVASVTQLGDDNRSKLTQANDDVDATVTQDTGTAVASGVPSNDSTITQRARFGTANVNQLGVGNSSTVTQGTSARSSNADVDQTNLAAGAVNTSTINQGAVRSRTQVSQNGEGNSSTVSTSGEDRNLAGFQIQVDQRMTGNTSSVTQASDSFAYVTQIGEGNGSTVEQFAGSSGSTADVDQLGDAGMSTVRQGNVGNTATVLQAFGSNGENSLIEQDGTNGSVTVTQEGSGNYSEVFQLAGDNNTATVNQGGMSNVSSITQSGDGNSATVTQAGSGALPST